MVSEGPGGKGTRIIDSEYPVTEGLTLGTTKIKGKQTNLTAEGQLSKIDNVESKDRELL